jgi:hypothetical protein
MDYTVLSLADVRNELDVIVRETQATFGDLDERRLNWRPDESRWSVAQCFEHLLAANRLMFRAAEQALQASAPRSIWQRVPVLPRLYGRIMIRTQSPDATRKFTADPRARPALSAIAADVIPRFIDQHRDAVAAVQTLDERDAARAVMTSPFIRFITYSVLDGWRLVVAHDRRHFEQARRVTLLPEFPKASVLPADGQRTVSLGIPDALAAKANTFPESSYGATTVTLILADGRRIHDVVLGGASHIVKVGGRPVSDAKDLDFSVSEIVDVKRKR